MLKFSQSICVFFWKQLKKDANAKTSPDPHAQRIPVMKICNYEEKRSHKTIL